MAQALQDAARGSLAGCVMLSKERRAELDRAPRWQKIAALRFVLQCLFSCHSPREPDDLDITQDVVCLTWNLSKRRRLVVQLWKDSGRWRLFSAKSRIVKSGEFDLAEVRVPPDLLECLPRKHG